MAKQLPYFKFEPSEWENGSIQLCSREEQGLFISLCCLYWQRLGNLPYKLALQKVCDGNAVALRSFCEHEIILIENENIRIKFLDLQLSEFTIIAQKNTQNAYKRWENTSAMRPHSDRNAIREEKIREDKITLLKEKKTREKIEIELLNLDPDSELIVREFCNFRASINKPFKSQLQLEKWIVSLQKLANGKFETGKQIVERSIANGWQGIFPLDPKNQSPHDKLTSIAEGIAEIYSNGQAR